MNEVLTIILLIIGAYLLGSIPSAVWIGRLFFNVDPRRHGSGNAGATNVLRLLGTKAALPVFAIDAAKGYAAVMLSWFSTLAPIDVSCQFSEPFINLRIALMICAILGHIFPIFASFRGGKGVATIAGCLIAIAPVPLACSFVVFVVFWSISHYVSLGSLTAAISFPLWVVVKYIIVGEYISPTMVIFSLVVASVMIFMHRANIKRLREHTEGKTYLFKKK
ncbi:MAG: glycerol-3-phosphate 1-O-acyltransferase PlsY [Mucinivorans sp.]